MLLNEAMHAALCMAGQNLWLLLRVIADSLRVGLGNIPDWFQPPQSLESIQLFRRSGIRLRAWGIYSW